LNSRFLDILGPLFFVVLNAGLGVHDALVEGKMGSFIFFHDCIAWLCGKLSFFSLWAGVSCLLCHSSASVFATPLNQTICTMFHWLASSIESILHHPWCHAFVFSMQSFLYIRSRSNME
jgi:hypothetical protein